MYTLLRQCRLRCLGHVRRMKDGRIPKDIFNGELAVGERPTGRPLLRFLDVCERDLKALDIDVDSWETLEFDRVAWKRTLISQLPMEKRNGKRNVLKNKQKGKLMLLQMRYLNLLLLLFAQIVQGTVRLV